MYSIIPVQAIPNRTFSSVIAVDGSNLTLVFTLHYNELAKYWLVDIAQNGTILISNLPVIPAENILEQYKYLQIGSAYILPRQVVKEQWPTYDSLASDWYLIWGDSDG